MGRVSGPFWREGIELTRCTEKLDEIRYVDYPDIQISKNESTEMPFRYVDDGRGDPVMPAVSLLRFLSGK